jgi:hypothetical protein
MALPVGFWSDCGWQWADSLCSGRCVYAGQTNRNESCLPSWREYRHLHRHYRVGSNDVDRCQGGHLSCVEKNDEKKCAVKLKAHSFAWQAPPPQKLHWPQLRRVYGSETMPSLLSDKRGNQHASADGRKLTLSESQFCDNKCTERAEQYRRWRNMWQVMSRKW